MHRHSHSSRGGHHQRHQQFQAQHFEPDFTKILISWSWDVFDDPLPEALEAQLPRTESSVSQYYQNFKPFILEEVRAIIANGLEKLRQYEAETASHAPRRGGGRQAAQAMSSEAMDAQPFSLELMKSGRLPKNEGNPLSLTFRGEIPRDIEHGPAMNMLLLKSSNGHYATRWLALANERPDQRELAIKLIAMPDQFYEHQECFEAGHRWTAHYLGSVVSEQRMYEACVAAVDVPCLAAIASGRVRLPSIPPHASIENLNLSQSRVVQGFLAAPIGSTLLLQGPPGTGKTTTIAKLLCHLDLQRSRTLVCAHSNKGVQVLAEKTMKLIPQARMILVGVEKKIPDELKHLSLTSWYQEILNHAQSILDTCETIKDKITRKQAHTIPYQEFVTLFEKECVFVRDQLQKFGFVDDSAIESDDIRNREFLEWQQHIQTLKSQASQKRFNLVNVEAFQSAVARLQGKWARKNKSDVEKQLLENASIIFATLVSSGRSVLSDMKEVDVLLIDEAAQSVEAATLIPMQYKPKKILLVGDPEQLPATVISPIHKKQTGSAHEPYTRFDWSMMWRLIKECDNPRFMLNIQYRMHPHICRWPSSQYYENQLVTSPTILPMKLLSDRGLARRPYALYNISGAAESSRNGRSVFNANEANYILKIIQQLRRQGLQNSIGVITPYVAQKQHVIQKLQGARLLENVEVNTVDSFQGDERDIIIISFVRSHVTAFLEEFRRLNVAITRSKYCLIMLANTAGLNRHDISLMIADTKLRNTYFSESDLNAELSQDRMDHPNLHLDYANEHYARWTQQVAHRPKEAFVLLRIAAEHNHVDAQYDLGRFYLSADNQCTKQDSYLGREWLVKSVNQGNMKADLFLAEYYQGCSNQKSAFDWFKYTADRWKLAEAQYKTACCYQKSEGTNPDITLMLDYFIKAAEQSHLKAQLCLAQYYSNSSTESDKREAVKWYRLAAEQAHSDIYLPLATLLVELNEEIEALRWYRESAKVGQQTAYFPLATLLAALNKWSESIKWYKEAGKIGNTDANYQLAVIYHQGEHAPFDLTEAINYYRIAAHAKHIESLHQLGMLKAAEPAHLIAQCRLAQDYSNHANKQEAIKWYRFAAEQEHQEAYFPLAKLLEQFNEWPEAIKWYEKSANIGNIEANYLLAVIYKIGEQTTLNLDKAIQYFRIAANANHIESLYQLGVMKAAEPTHLVMQYRHAQDYSNRGNKDGAIKWYRLTAEQGHQEAYFPLAKLLAERKENVEAIKWYRESASAGNAKAYFPLATLLAKSHEWPEAVKWYKEAAKAGDSEASYQLAAIYQKGEHQPRNLAEAMNYYSAAAQVNHVESLYQLGLIYEKGDEGIPIDADKAKSHYQRAAALQHPLAIKRLSLTYNISRFFSPYLSSNDTVPTDEELKNNASSCVVM